MPHELPVACSLDAAEMSERRAELAVLGADALVGVEAGRGRAVLRFAGEPERVAALVDAERRCCGFFDFDLECDGEGTTVEIRGPVEAESILRAFVAELVAGWRPD